MTSIENNHIKVLFDTNVIIDALTDRGEYYNYSQKLLLLVADEKIDGYISSKQVTDIYYIIRKYFNEKQRRATIGTLLNVLKVLPLLPSDVKYCINSKMDDYEDAIIDETAKVNMISYLVTNNIKDFNNSKSIIMTPKDLYTIVSIEQ